MSMITDYMRDYYESSYPASILSGGTAPPGQTPTPGATKGAAAPGNVFPAEPTVTAQNAGNAAKLAGLGFVADPQTAWTPGQGITILPTFHFSWDGAQWVAGNAHDPTDTPPDDVIIVPDPEPGPDPLPGPTPDETWSKDDIIAWLAEHGIDIDKKAEDTLSKVELLALADDVTDVP